MVCGIGVTRFIKAVLVASWALTLVACGGKAEAELQNESPDSGIFTDAAVAPDVGKTDAGIESACEKGEKFELGPGLVGAGAFGDGHFGVVLDDPIYSPRAVVFVDSTGTGERLEHPFSSSPALAAELASRGCPGPRIRLGWLGDRWLVVAANRAADLRTTSGFGSTIEWSPSEPEGVFTFLDAAIHPNGFGVIAFDGVWHGGEDVWCAEGPFVFQVGATTAEPASERVQVRKAYSPPMPESAAVGVRSDGFAVAQKGWDEASVSVISVLQFSAAGEKVAAFNAPIGNVDPPGVDPAAWWSPNEVRMDAATIAWTNRSGRHSKPDEIALHVGRIGDLIIKESEVARLVASDPSQSLALRFSVVQDGDADVVAWIEDRTIHLRRVVGAELVGAHSLLMDEPVGSVLLLRANDGTLAIAWSEVGVSYLSAIECELPER